MKKWIISTALLLVVIVGIWYFTIFIPDRNMRRQEEANFKTATAVAVEARKKEQQYQLCKALAYADYKENWANNCRLAGLKNDCILPIYKANTLDDRLEFSYDECLQKYY